MRTAFPGWEVEALAADDYPPETGETYYENALVKARHGRRLAPPDAWVLGEDSGIEVDALGGGPGVSSARWAEPGRQHEALLERLGDEERRTARMIAHMVAIGPSGEEIDAVGVIDGEIGDESRGSEGFGYDPVFVPDGETRTMAELGDAWKREHSHRARAAEALRAVLGAS